MAKAGIAEAGMAARWLARQAALGAGLALGLVTLVPLFWPADRPGFPVLWPLLMLAAMAVLLQAAHILLDAGLFRLAASASDAASAEAELDDILDRCGLRARPSVPVPLARRLEGSRRLVWRLHATLALLVLAIATFVLVGPVSSNPAAASLSP